MTFRLLSLAVANVPVEAALVEGLCALCTDPFLIQIQNQCILCVSDALQIPCQRAKWTGGLVLLCQ